VTTWAVVTEVLHLLGRGGGGWPGQEPFARRLGDGSLEVADLAHDLGLRSLALMAAYADQPMDFADATLVALAEARRDFRVVTFDSDFRVYRAAGGQVFELLDGPA
jgi:uncharacterized protein